MNRFSNAAKTIFVLSSLTSGILTATFAIPAQAEESYITCTSASPNIKSIKIDIVNFKTVPDQFSGDLPACSYVPSGSPGMELKYPASGLTVQGPDGQTKTYWMAATVTDASGKVQSFSQYSLFIVRAATFSSPTPCTQGLFISEGKDVLDFAANEPSQGLGRARLKGETMTLQCKFR